MTSSATALLLFAALAVPARAETPPPASTLYPPPAVAACGWHDSVQKRTLEHATRMMPTALRRILRRHDKALRRGAAAEQRRLPTSLHAEDPGGGDSAADRLAASVSRITALLDAQAPFERVAWEMGAASHLIADLTNPFRTAPRDGDSLAFEPAFLAYMEEQLPDLRVVFTSYEHPLLARGDTGAFGRSLAGTARSYLDDLVGALRLHQQTGEQAYIDQRSVPFGVASLSFSRGVTDTARVWLHAWRAAHGSLRGLPYPLEPAPDPAATTNLKGKP